MGKKKKKKKKIRVDDIDLREREPHSPAAVAPAAASETGVEVRPAGFEEPPTSTYIEGDLVQFVDDAGQIARGIVIPAHPGGGDEGARVVETKFNVE